MEKTCHKLLTKIEGTLIEITLKSHSSLEIGKLDFLRLDKTLMFHDTLVKGLR